MKGSKCLPYQLGLLIAGLDAPEHQHDAPRRVRCAKTRQDAPRRAKTRQDTPTRAKTRQDMPRRAKTHQDAPRPAKTRQDTPRRAKTRSDAPRRSKTHRDAPRRAKTCRDTNMTRRDTVWDFFNDVVNYASLWSSTTMLTARHQCQVAQLDGWPPGGDGGRDLQRAHGDALQAGQRHHTNLC